MNYGMVKLVSCIFISHADIDPIFKVLPEGDLVICVCVCIIYTYIMIHQ